MAWVPWNRIRKTKKKWTIQYTMYMYGIYHTYSWICNIHGICMVYTIHIPCKIFIGVPDEVLRPWRIRRWCPYSNSPVWPVVVTCSSLGLAVDAEMIEYRSASSAVPPMAWAVVLPDVSESASSASRQLVYTSNVVCCKTNITGNMFIHSRLVRPV